MTVVVPIRQMKDIDQHISWNSGPVFRDLKQKASKKKKEEEGGMTDSAQRQHPIGCYSKRRQE